MTTGAAAWGKGKGLAARGGGRASWVHPQTSSERLKDHDTPASWVQDKRGGRTGRYAKNEAIPCLLPKGDESEPSFLEGFKIDVKKG